MALIPRSELAPHGCLQPRTRRSRSQYHTCLARPCQSRYNQHLRRDRPRDEGAGDGTLRCGRGGTDAAVEGGSRGDGVPPVTLSAERNVAESPASPLRDKRIPAHRNIPRTATCHHAPHSGLDGDTPLERLARCSHKVRYAGPDMDLGWIFSYRFVRRAPQVPAARSIPSPGSRHRDSPDGCG